MVSNASELLPDPDNPVTTISLSRGISSEIFLRLWTRAPCTAIVVRAPAFGAADSFDLELIRRLSQIYKREFLNLDVTSFRDLRSGRGFADQSLIGKVFASGRNAF